MEQYTYKPNQQFITVSLILVLIVLIVSAVIMSLKGYSIGYNVIPLVICIYIAWPQTRLLFRREALIISSEGITDYTKSLGFIPWSKIRDVRITKVGIVTNIELDLFDPQEIINAQPLLTSLLFKYGLSKGILPYIGISFVDVQNEKALEQMEMFLKKNKEHIKSQIQNK